MNSIQEDRPKSLFYKMEELLTLSTEHNQVKPKVLAAMHSIHCENKHAGEDLGFKIEISEVTSEGFLWKVVLCHP